MTRLARRKMLVLTGGALASPLLAGCGEDGSSNKIYTVGSTPDGPPFSFLDRASNKPIGMMNEIVQAVARDANIKLRFEMLLFAEMVPALFANKIDVSTAGLLRTPEREQVVSFTQPVYTMGGAVVLPAGDSRLCPNLGALTDATVGAEDGSRLITQLEEAGVTAIKPYPSFPEVLHALHKGEIQAGYGAQASIVYQLRTEPDLKLRVAKDFKPPVLEDMCLATRKNDFEFIAKLNVSIERLRAREIRAILQRWGMV